jgi:dipeptide/tripeptide permease
VLAGLGAVTAGLLVAALAAALSSPVLVVAAAVVLGCGYGCCLVAGLLQTQRVAPRGELAGLTAVYYALTYAGFVAPVVLGQLARVTSYPVLLLALAALALLTLLAAGRPARA